MAMRMENVVVDCRDERALGRWWAEALGWVYVEDRGEVCVRERIEADGSYPYPELIFGRDDDPDAGQERVHLDLNSHSLDEQRAIVERLLAMGARHADVGQAADAPFVVLADPEGNHFCVLDPRPGFAEVGSLAGYTLAAHDAQAIKDVWVAATGWDVQRDDPDWVVLVPPAGGPNLELITRPTMAPGTAKNRIHLDVAPGADDDQDEAVERLLALGAVRVDVGQHDGGPLPWVVLADPEGNELCVLTPRP